MRKSFITSFLSLPVAFLGRKFIFTSSSKGVSAMQRKTVIRLLVILYVTFPFAHAGEWVTFQGNTKAGDEITLKGILEKPQAKGPFPAVVVLHGCSGIEKRKKYYDVWAQRLVSWGYVALLVDSLGPRGETNICDNTRVFLIPPTCAHRMLTMQNPILPDFPL